MTKKITLRDDSTFHTFVDVYINEERVGFGTNPRQFKRCRFVISQSSPYTLTETIIELERFKSDGANSSIIHRIRMAGASLLSA